MFTPYGSQSLPSNRQVVQSWPGFPPPSPVLPPPTPVVWVNQSRAPQRSFVDSLEHLAFGIGLLWTTITVRRHERELAALRDAPPPPLPPIDATFALYEPGVLAAVRAIHRVRGTEGGLGATDLDDLEERCRSQLGQGDVARFSRKEFVLLDGVLRTVLGSEHLDDDERRTYRLLLDLVSIDLADTLGPPRRRS